VAKAPLHFVLRHIFRLAGGPAAEEVSDRQLLDRFVRHGEGDAFALLLHRHGGMVLHACRRVLRHEQDAEDVFQAAFLLLARKAASIRKPEAVASWLYGVAYRLALKAKLQNSRRQAREQRAVDMHPSDPSVEAAWRELQTLLDEELHRLPAKYQAPLVLCYLEGKTQEEAARQLGWPLGTVRGRLARARDLLRTRLARRGLTLTVSLFGSTLAANSAGTVPARLVEPTLQGALHFAAGRATVELVSARVLALAEEGVKAMTAGSLKLITTFLLAAGLTAAGAGTLARLAGSGGPPKDRPAETARRQPPADKKTRPVKGKPVGHLDSFGDPLPAQARARLGTARLWPGLRQVSALAFSADSKTLATARADGVIHLWEMPSGKKVGRVGTGANGGGRLGEIGVLALAPDGKTLATIESPLKISMREVASGKQLWEAYGPPATPLHCCAFSPDSKILATPWKDHQIQLREAATGNKLRTCQGHQDPVTALAFSADGKTLVSASDDLTIRLWRTGTGKPLRFCQGHRGTIQALAVSADGQTVASAGKDNTIRLWEAGTGKQVRRWKVRGDWTVHHSGPISLQFAADGKTLSQTSFGGLWEFATATGKLVRQLQLPTSNFGFVCQSPNGKHLAVAYQWQPIQLWDVTSGKEIRPAQGHRGSISAVTFSPDGKTLASAAWDRTIRLWRLADFKEVRCLRGHTGIVSSLYFTADGKHLVSASADPEDRVISLWEPATGKEVRQLRGFRGGLKALALSADGRLAACTARDGLLHVWETATGKQLPTTRCFAEALTFSPDSKRLAFVDLTARVQLWDPAAGKVVRTFRSPENPQFYSYAIAFSPDGKRLYKSNILCHLDTWEAGTGVYLGQIQGQPDPRDASWTGKFGHAPLLFSRDGRTVALPGKDGSVCLVEFATGKLRRSFAGRQGGVTALAFSPDGKTVASGGSDSTILLWGLTAPAAGEKRARGSLTAAELAALAADLAGEDAVKAYRAMRVLTAVPAQAVPFLKKLVKPVRPADMERLDPLIADLGHKQFSRRRKATQKLEELGELARPALIKALRNKPDAELKIRLDRLTARLQDRSLVPKNLLAVRAVEVLEAIGTAAARQVLVELAQGVPGAGLTEQARSTRERLGRQGR
jgi:RNA polymerase sigma factor (sigma-70 family)